MRCVKRRSETTSLKEQFEQSKNSLRSSGAVELMVVAEPAPKQASLVKTVQTEGNRRDGISDGLCYSLVLCFQSTVSAERTSFKEANTVRSQENELTLYDRFLDIFN